MREVEDFLACARDAVIIEDGAVIFDLAESKYSISGEHHKCLVHLWSAERNIVRRVLDAEIKHEVLRLTVQRMGAAKPAKLEICRERDRRTPTAKRAARLAYQRALHRVLQRRFAGFKVAQLSTFMDLERSFGPIYARGLLRRGQSGFAVLGVNEQEAQVSIDAALTFGILWLDACRQAQAGKLLVEGLMMFVPSGASVLTRERMAHLDRDAAKWQLYEFDEPTDALKEIDVFDCGNVATRLVHSTDEQPAAALRQGDRPGQRVSCRKLKLQCCRRRKLHFVVTGWNSPARAWRMMHSRFAARPKSCSASARRTRARRIERCRLYATGAQHRRSAPRRRPARPSFVASASRALAGIAGGAKTSRPSTSGWIRPCLYSQVPAFSASDRAMIDVLTVTREGRLAVVELKADEDIHLPLQGLDYWSRVAWHHARGEFQRFGYFPGRELCAEKPLLYLVAPALHVHPATDTLLHYISPEIDWVLVGIDERWRQGVHPIFWKRPRRQSVPETHIA